MGRLLTLALATACVRGDGVQFPLEWRWSNPLPHGNTIADMAYSAALALGVQVTDGGRIYTSSDLQTWIPRESGTFKALRGVCFFGARMVATGEEGTVLYADAPGSWLSGSLGGGPTTNWLESVTASASLVVAVGDRATVYTSPDGAAWTRQAVNATSHWLRGVAYGAVLGGRFVAVGESGTILLSTNGTNWSAVNSGVMVDLNRVSYGNGEFNAVGNSGVVLRSVNGGSNWLPRDVLAKTNLYAATTGGLNILVAGDSEVRLYDPVTRTWLNELAHLDGPPDWSYFAAVGRPGLFLLGGRNGMMAEGVADTSGDFSWTPLAVSSRSWLFDAVWMTNLFVAVGDRSAVMTSGNGIDWSLESVPAALTNRVLLGVGGTTNLLVAVGSAGGLMVSPQDWTNVVSTNLDGSVTNRLVNTLGVVWHAIPLPGITHDLQGVACLGARFVVCGGAGTLLTSLDGTNWNSLSPPTSALLSSVAASGSNVVAAGKSGTLLFSPDGLAWQLATSGVTNWIYRVRAFPGGYLAVGEAGLVLTSPDGVSWTRQETGTSEWLYDVAWLENTWFVVGSGGTVLASTNQADWLPAGSITSKALYAAAAGGSRLLAFGTDGAILRSRVVPDPTPVEILDYSRIASTNGLELEELFLFAGQPDQQFTVDQREDLEAAGWADGPALEFLGGSGTLYYLRSLAVTNALPSSYYRATLVP